jgi:hypothetical protein
MRRRQQSREELHKPPRKFMTNDMGFKHKLGRGVALLRPGERVIFSPDIPPDR